MPNQPKGLFVLCNTEMWERFGFYTIQTIFILYMSRGLHFSDHEAYLIYGSFSSLLYLTPVIGGYLADRYTGFQNAIVSGGVLLMAGYFLCAFKSYSCFIAGLSLVIIGNGLLKPNISSIVGTLYQANDARRDGGFTLFYMGINIGSMIPPLFVGFLVERYGWHSGFIMATAGMALGLLFFLYNKRILQNKGGVPETSPFYKASIFNRISLAIFAGIIVSALVIYWLLAHHKVTMVVFIALSIFYMLWVIVMALKETKEKRNKIIAALLLIFISIGFWTLYNQTFTSLMLFAERNMVHSSFLGLRINAEFTQFFNPFFIILLSPILSLLWVRLARFKKNINIPAKFFMSTLFLMSSFVLLTLVCMYMANDKGKVSVVWLILFYFLQTVGELLISPVGLSMITVLVPKRLTGIMMGMWFLSTAASFALSGLLATLSGVTKEENAFESLAVYSHSFMIFTLIAVALCVLTMALLAPVKRLAKFR